MREVFEPGDRIYWSGGSSEYVYEVIEDRGRYITAECKWWPYEGLVCHLPTWAGEYRRAES
jgi:hypothetical protein